MTLHTWQISFNDYFVSIGNQLAAAIISPGSKQYPVSCQGSQKSFVLHETTSEEVKIIIDNLLVSKSVRMNDIPIHILKICKQILSPFLAQLFNRWVKTSIYPEFLKCTQVIPIHKGGQKSLYKLYAYIPAVSIWTNFEKLIYIRLYSYVEQNKMLSDSQYGFRSGLSTSMAIYDIHENLLKNREEKYTTCAIFCDLSKAFDTIGHSILLHKLEQFYGIRGLPLKLLTSFLPDRQRYTVVEGCKSDVQNINRRVPQGSMLGPPLFALYINDLPKFSRFRTTMFADDTLLSFSSNKPTRPEHTNKCWSAKDR